MRNITLWLYFFLISNYMSDDDKSKCEDIVLSNLLFDKHVLREVKNKIWPKIEGDIIGYYERTMYDQTYMSDENPGLLKKSLFIFKCLFTYTGYNHLTKDQVHYLKLLKKYYLHNDCFFTSTDYFFNNNIKKIMSINKKDELTVGFDHLSSCPLAYLYSLPFISLDIIHRWDIFIIKAYVQKIVNLKKSKVGDFVYFLNTIFNLIDELSNSVSFFNTIDYKKAIIIVKKIQDTIGLLYLPNMKMIWEGSPIIKDYLDNIKDKRFIFYGTPINSIGCYLNAEDFLGQFVDLKNKKKLKHSGHWKTYIEYLKKDTRKAIYI